MKHTICLKYSVFFNINKDGISISFPDIPGCLSCAFSKKEALKMAKEALELWLHNMKISDIPPANYPIKRYTSKEFLIRPIKVKMNVKDNALFCDGVVEFN